LSLRAFSMVCFSGILNSPVRLVRSQLGATAECVLRRLFINTRAAGFVSVNAASQNMRRLDRKS
jgi:hypothetical protein